MKNKIYTVLNLVQIVVSLSYLCYAVHSAYYSHALHLRVEQSEFISINEMRRTVVEAIRDISPKCEIKIDDSEYDDGTIGIRVDHMTKKERIQLESVIPYWSSIHIG